MTNIQYRNLTIRRAEVSDSKQLTGWWNDGAVMAHAGFPGGLGTTEEKVIAGLGNGHMVIEENARLIGECNFRDVADGGAEIGIKTSHRATIAIVILKDYWGIGNGSAICWNRYADTLYGEHS